MPPQVADILLDAAPYMIAAGSYARRSDGPDEATTERWSQRDFVGGLRRAIQLERDTAYTGTAVRSVMAGQGIEPWGGSGTVSEATAFGITGNPSSGSRIPSVIATTSAGTHAYYGLGRYLYRSPSVTGGWPANSLVQVADLGAGATITDLAVYQSNKVAICTGSFADIKLWDGAAVTTLSAGEKGTRCVGYNGRLLFSSASTPGELRMTTGGGIDSRRLDAPIISLGLHQGKAVIATRSSLYTLGGKGDGMGSWSEDPVGFSSQGQWASNDDFQWLLSHAGKLYTWVGGAVAEWNPNTGSNRTGWRTTLLEGLTNYGACIAGGFLVVCLAEITGNITTWAFDGSGWWPLPTNAAACWPTTTGRPTSYDLLTFRDNANTADFTQLLQKGANDPPYAASAAFVTSLIDAGSRDTIKAWGKIGASFGTPEVRGNPASVDSVTINLDTSVDGGATWTTQATWTPSSGSTQLHELTAEPAAGIGESCYLQIRVRWSSVSDWAPTLTGLWTEYQVLDQKQRRRRWKFTVLCQDTTVQRDGNVSTRTGRQLSADLWAAWASNTTLTYRDIDYDDDPTQRSVRIATIAETTQHTTDAAHWGHSLIALSLIEL